MFKVTTLALALIAGSANAENVTIFTGKEGGGYDAAARTVAERLSQRGHVVTIVNRNGSDDITLQACAATGPVMWIAQKDAVWTREMRDGCALVDVGVHATEYAMLFTPPKARADELDELRADDAVLVDGVGSGSELTWRTMGAIEAEHGRGDAWATARAENATPTRAASMAERGTIQAVMLVRTPQSTDVRRLLEAGWKLAYLYDRDINDLEWNGTPLYESVQIEVTDRGRKLGKNYGYAVPSFWGTTALVERDYPALFDDMVSAVN